MRKSDQMLYRLRLSEGFLHEARQDLTLKRWRSCVDNSQLAVENAAKVFLAYLGPVGRTHNPAELLGRALRAGEFPEAWRAETHRMTDLARQLGPAIHAQSDYGDEEAGRTPWDLFDETSARAAVQIGEEAVVLARAIVQQRARG